MYVYAFNILFVPTNLWGGRADFDADADDIRIMALPAVVVVSRGSASSNLFRYRLFTLYTYVRNFV